MLHPDHLLSSLSAAQVEDWMAYIRIEGLPDGRNDYLLAQIMTGMVAAFGGKLDLIDCMPWMKPPVDHASLDDAETRSAQIMAIIGGCNG
ncbi:MAG: hypothetical protein HQL86_03065 [Magnetococcales bacterium]|nr:hypothetical protein [Magnetococcales bacterium]